VRELSGSSVVRATVPNATGDATWRQLVTSAPTSGGTRLSVDVLVSLPKGSKAQVDDLSLRG